MKNPNKKYKPEKVMISVNSMITKKDKINVTMDTKKGYDIYYSLDGSIPNKTNKRYNKKEG